MSPTTKSPLRHWRDRRRGPDHSCRASSIASAIAACSPVSFEPTTSRALVICWPHPNARPLRRTVRPRTLTPKDLRLCAAAPAPSVVPSGEPWAQSARRIGRAAWRSNSERREGLQSTDSLPKAKLDPACACAPDQAAVIAVLLGIITFPCKSNTKAVVGVKRVNAQRRECAESGLLDTSREHVTSIRDGSTVLNPRGFGPRRFGRGSRPAIAAGRLEHD